MNLEVNNMSHSLNHKRKENYKWNRFLLLEYCQKLLFTSVSSDFFEIYIATNNFCVSSHKFYCSLENFNFHILLIGSSFDRYLQRLGNFHFT